MNQQQDVESFLANVSVVPQKDQKALLQEKIIALNQ